MEQVTADGTCQCCKYCDSTDYIDMCKKSIKRVKSPEGVSYIRSQLPCGDALSEFRSRNGGVCPYFKKSIVYRIVGFVDRLLGVET